jgi:glucose-6-phosphate dehydrogenase assembly protein OpcA
MMFDLTDTSTGAIHEALARSRRRLGGSASGMVLTLIVDTDEAAQYDAMRAASQAGRAHPCRVIGVITRRPDAGPRLDAEIRAGDAGPGEMILLRLYGPLGEHADSVVAPLLLLDIPVMTWWPGQPPAVPSQHPLGALAQRRITDAAASESPHQALSSLAAAYKPGDTDLSWARITTWRSLLAATLDQPYPPLVRGEVLADPANPSGDLLAAWLSARLGIPVHRGSSEGPGITSVSLTTEQGEIGISRPDGRTATLSRTSEPDRRVALHRREAPELLSEEMRRLDPDDVYAESLARLHGTARVPGGEEPGSFTLEGHGTPSAAGGPAAGPFAGPAVRAATDPGEAEAALDAGRGESAGGTEEEISRP